MLKVLNQLMIEALNFTVGLGVIGRRSIVVDLVSLDKCLELFGSELFSIVRNDLSGFPVGPDDVFEDLYNSCSGAFLEGPGKGSRGCIVDSGYDVSIAMVCFKQFPDEVDFPELESLFDTVGVNCCSTGRIRGA